MLVTTRGGYRIFSRGGRNSSTRSVPKFRAKREKNFEFSPPPKLISPPPAGHFWGGGKMSLGGGAKTQKYSYFLKGTLHFINNLSSKDSLDPSE